MVTTDEMAISLEGRVAVVTGGGRGLGHAYATLLAERGASIVLNDLGTSLDGGGHDATIAQAAVSELEAAGGTAVPDHHDVSSSDGGRAVIDRALEAFGRVDVVVSNAGTGFPRAFAESTVEDFESHWRIHLGGAVNVVGAAWPHMLEQGYGRVILVSSGAGLFGYPGFAAYSAAKAAVFGLGRSLALEGRDHGILVNSVMPGGASRNAGSEDPELRATFSKLMPPELVAPTVAWLASDACQVSGQAFSALGGRVARVRVGSGYGYVNREQRPEDIAQHYGDVETMEGFYEPTDAADEINKFIV